MFVASRGNDGRSSYLKSVLVSSFYGTVPKTYFQALTSQNLTKPMLTVYQSGLGHNKFEHLLHHLLTVTLDKSLYLPGPQFSHLYIEILIVPTP